MHNLFVKNPSDLVFFIEMSADDLKHMFFPLHEYCLPDFKITNDFNEIVASNGDFKSCEHHFPIVGTMEISLLPQLLELFGVSKFVSNNSIKNVKLDVSNEEACFFKKMF